ncbi:MAG: hypothetical protein IV085_05895 [Thiobacillus sp.]|nr:hypothetical protein [Thiobacillus sp.]
MAGINRTNNLNDAPVLEYNQHAWGDLIYGTKEQLQRIGIAAGMAFPGEPNGPKRVLRVTDPRGLTAKVEASTWRGEGIFNASISFPGRDRPEHGHVTDFAPGVSREESLWGDVFTGTAESLSAAGLVRRDQLPGQPGMRKTTVTILADGSLPQGAPTANCPEAHEPGARRISRKSKTLYEVCVRVSDEEEERRREENSRADREWEARMMSLPRPAPLCRTSQELKEIETAKSLVASWPKSPADFRESVRGGADMVLMMLENTLLDGVHGGYRYNDATARKIKALVGQLRGLVEGGGIEKDLELMKQQIPACISDSALADDASQATEKAKSSPQYGGNVVPFRPAQTA